MPYIANNKRWELQGRYAENPGELNFKITQLIVRYLKVKGLSYQTINDILGALSGAKEEFYRKVAVPYEDIKLVENGDVYNWDSTTETFAPNHKPSTKIRQEIPVRERSQQEGAGSPQTTVDGSYQGAGRGVSSPREARRDSQDKVYSSDAGV